MTIKLSEIQHAALVQVSELGYTVAKANTIKSLENKELIDAVGATHHKLTSKGRAVLGLPAVAEPATAWEALGEIGAQDVSHEELKSLLQGDPWKMGEQITADEPYLEFPSEPVIDLDSTITQVVTFDKDWALWERELCGFGATLGWDNTEVWHGLTAEEIRDDMDTRVPANRADKRKHAKMVRRVFKQLASAL